MQSEDKLTRAERIRLEAFAQVGQRNFGKPLLLAQHMRDAEEVEEWLRKANDKFPVS